MTPRGRTQPIEVELPGVRRGGNGRSSETSDAWSFGADDRVFAPAPRRFANERSAAANTSESHTFTPHITADPSHLKPVAVSRPLFGKRGFTATYQWEGVVEGLHAAGFRARLLPFENGVAEVSRVEYADFDFDDLADESDYDLVAEGAVFYWTVGKSRNPAGTLTNTSLVRFRRLPPPTPYQNAVARREAVQLLADLEIA